MGLRQDNFLVEQFFEREWGLEITAWKFWTNLSENLSHLSHLSQQLE